MLEISNVSDISPSKSSRRKHHQTVDVDTSVNAPKHKYSASSQVSNLSFLENINYSQVFKSKKFFIALIAIIAIFVILNSFNSKGNTNTSTNSSNSTTIQGANNEIKKIGSNVPTGDLEWAVLSVENMGGILNPKDPKAQDKLADGKFVRVRVSVKNTGKDAVKISDLKIQDSEGKEFEPNNSLTEFIDKNEQKKDDNLKSGEQKTVAFIWDIPKGSGGLFLITSYGKESNKISLGI